MINANRLKPYHDPRNCANPNPPPPAMPADDRSAEVLPNFQAQLSQNTQNTTYKIEQIIKMKRITFLYFLYPRLAKCQNHSDFFTTPHPVNLALIQHFFSPEIYKSIMGDTTFTQPIDLDIPNFHIYNHTFSNILAQDKQYHLSLKRMAKAASKGETIFTSLSEPLVDSELPVSSGWPDLNGIICIAALVLSIVLALVCLVLLTRLQTITTAFLLLQKATLIHGLSLSSPIPIFH
ncbi:unnamed protein product [Mytilus coruscus]|uniref:Uncharacterized protein n=1 Tax=Mytilus coruscus TaxID=42192 RepID=A0A6J8CAT0_MYTCO|nr:unnamed protein product [Mytilus coruscus]